MRYFVGYAVMGAALLACSSDDTSAASGCGDISGNYSVTSAKVSGSCEPAASNTSSLSMRQVDGVWTAMLPTIESGCPGTFDESTCRFVADCKLVDPTSGSTLVTISADYTFRDRAFSGSSVIGLVPPAAAVACEATYSDTATKL